MFAGPHKKSREHNPVELKDLLTLPDQIAGTKEDQHVYQILKDGRSYRSRFDQKESTLAAFLFCKLGKEKTVDLFQNTHLKPSAFIEKLPADVLAASLMALSHTAVARKASIEELVQFSSGKRS